MYYFAAHQKPKQQKKQPKTQKHILVWLIVCFTDVVVEVLRFVCLHSLIELICS